MSKLRLRALLCYLRKCFPNKKKEESVYQYIQVNPEIIKEANKSYDYYTIWSHYTKRSCRRLVRDKVKGKRLKRRESDEENCYYYNREV